MTQQLLDMYCFSLKSIYSIFWQASHSRDIFMTLFLLSTEKLKENSSILLLFVCLLSEIINDGIKMQNKKQNHKLFNVFHM